jgi:DNA-binding response OmpR family regulator
VVGGAGTILFAEDDKMIRTMVTRLLGVERYRVFPAGSGLEALALWREHRDEIDLLLTDVMMLDGTRGDDLAADLTAMRPGLQVVFLSGYGPEFNRGLVLEQGVNFLHKPFRLADLLRTVRAALDRAKHAR